MPYIVNQLKEKKKSKFWPLFFVILWATNFCGFAPIALLYPSGLSYELPVLFIMIFIGFNKVEKGKYKNWYILLLLSLILNYCSTLYFEDTLFVEAIRGASFVHYLFIFYVFVYINPTIYDIEKNIKIIGFTELVLYFIQKIIYPIPILESLAIGWRINNDISNFDMLRFTVTGELIMFFYLFLSFNKAIILHKFKYYIPVLLVIFMCILHGYRSVLIAMIISLFIQYVWIKGFRFNKTIINMIIILTVVVWGISQIPFVSDIWQIMADKQENDFSSGNSLNDMNRIIEFNYFLEYQIKNFIEWIFGCGFIGNSIDRGRNYQGWINWADLGFIGLSFMGGLFMTYCWIRLLLLNIRKRIPHSFIYLSIFSIFVIISTIFLPTAFNDQAPVIQALALFMGYKIFNRPLNIYRFKFRKYSNNVIKKG